jgi:hypothetical protein
LNKLEKIRRADPKFSKVFKFRTKFENFKKFEQNLSIKGRGLLVREKSDERRDPVGASDDLAGGSKSLRWAPHFMF